MVGLWGLGIHSILRFVLCVFRDRPNELLASQEFKCSCATLEVVFCWNYAQVEMRECLASKSTIPSNAEHMLIWIFTYSLKKSEGRLLRRSKNGLSSLRSIESIDSNCHAGYFIDLNLG